jgi:ligand-binding sensor domain-containing protein/two-component sensor histidine kinase
MKKAIALIATLFFSITVLFSQQGFTFNRISIEDGIGLASNVVYCTYQDPKGFIWVGTANGLQRFDGSKFIQLSFGKNTTSKALRVSSLTQIIPADSVCLWLYFPNRQEFGIFNTSTFEYKVVPITSAKSLIAKNELRLWKDKKGEVFITVLGYGIFHYDKKKKIFADDNYFHFPKGWASTLGHFEDTLTNRYWFPCVGNGFAVYDANDSKLYTTANNPKNIPLLKNKEINQVSSEVFIDSKRRYWMFNWPNAHLKRCFDSTGKQLGDTVGLNYNPDYSEMRNFYETRQGLLWLYGLNGLYNYDRDERRFVFYEHGPGSPEGIEFQYVHQVMEDHDGSIWVATDNGLYFATPGSGTMGVVNMLFTDKNIKTEFIDATELKSGRRWLSTWGKGIFTFEQDMIRRYDAGIYRNMPQMEDVRWVQYRQVWALYQHTDGKVWIGCQGSNYMVYDTLTRTTKFLKADALNGSTIRYITGDKKGNLWFGTMRGTIAKYDGKKFTIVQELGSLIHKILVDNEGLIWVAPQSNGIFCLSPDGTKILRHYVADGKENSLFANLGKDIEQLDDSTIVFGAGAMNFINKRTGKVRWLTFDDGLPSNSIQRMRRDSNGYIWMITLNGLCRYNPSTKRVTPYGRKDGVTVSNLTIEADYLCSDGTVLFTGSNAALYFHPEVFKDKQPPDVRITDFKLFDNYIPVDSLLALPKIKLGCDQNSFSIYFAALSYSQREKLTYYYKISGVDKDWVKADRQNFISYTLLPHGKYTFSVYCENIDGTRSKNITELVIYIKPPFWQTYWFISVFLFVVALGIYGVHRLRVNKILAVEKLRTRVARDLHDDMGSTLSTINILSSMAKSKINVDPIRTTEYLGKISDNSQRMMDAMDDIVWSIKPSNDSMQKITARMREFANNVLEAKEIELDFRVDDTVFDIKLNMEARRDFFLVFKEAVNNAAKYSRASMVTVQLGMHNHRLVLLVEDDGIGFDPETADGGNGLGNMQKRASAMEGRLQVVSKAGGGTTVTLNVPIQ